MENVQEYILCTKNISKKYPGVQALKNIDFKLKKGEIRAIVGENGAGKSTFIKIISGVQKADDGFVEIEGKKVQINNPNSATNHGIAVVHQERSLFPNLSIATNIFFDEIDSENLFFVPDSKINSKAFELLHDFGLGGISPSKRVNSLEPGQQQLVEIARAVVKNAKIIIFDEPTSSLSNKEKEILFKIIKNLKKKGMSVIFISHRLDEIFDLCDSITVFRDGEHITTVQTSELSNAELVELILGREEKEMYKGVGKLKSDKELLKVKNLKILPKIEDISFNLREGEILGIAGLLGAGKTEIARAIFGLDDIDGGEIYFHGKRVKITNSNDAIDLGMGFITEDRHKDGLLLEKSVKDNVVLCNLKKCSNKIGWMISKKEVSSAKNQVKNLDLKTPSIYRKVKYLSGGNQQKVVLGKWLEKNPRLFIMDDPTRGVDVGCKAEFYRIILDLAEQGAGIIFISSELEEIVSVCHRVLVIRNGKISAEYSGKEINKPKILMRMAGE